MPVRVWSDMSAHILIINPNSTASMTREIEIAAREVADQNTTITAVNPDTGPASIEGPEDGLACLPPLFALFDTAMASNIQYDAIIIACFDDTGLQELKSRTIKPVLGIGEAAFHMASMRSKSFSTVTTLPISIPVIAQNILHYGFSKQSKKVRASDVPVLAVGSETARLIEAEAKRALLEDQCDSIVLGCAGMAQLAKELSHKLDVPVIDGVAAAVLLSEALIRLESL